MKTIPPMDRPGALAGLFHSSGMLVLALACMGFVTGHCAPPEFLAQGPNVDVLMPGSDPLRIRTIVSGDSPDGWVETKLVSEEEPGANAKSFHYTFKDGANLKLKRTLQAAAGSLSGDDSWTVDQDVVGFLRFELNIPYEQFEGGTISTPFGEFTGGQMAEVMETKSFLRHKDTTQFTFKNKEGSSFRMTFSQGVTFELQCQVPVRRVNIRAFWTPQNTSLKDGELNWKIDANPAD